MISATGRWALNNAILRLNLVSGSPCCWPHTKFPSLPPWHFVHEFIEWWQWWIGKETDWSAYPLYHSCPLEVTLWWTLTWDTVMSNFLLIQRGLLTFFFPKFLSQQFCNHVPSKSLTIQPNHWPQSMKQYTILHLAISPLKWSEQPVTYFQLKNGKKHLSLKTKLWASKSLQFYIKTYYTKTEIALYILILKYFLYFPYRECDFQYFLYLFFIWFKKFSNYAIKIRNKYHPINLLFPPHFSSLSLPFKWHLNFLIYFTYHCLYYIFQSLSVLQQSNSTHKNLWNFTPHRHQ